MKTIRHISDSKHLIHYKTSQCGEPQPTPFPQILLYPKRKNECLTDDIAYSSIWCIFQIEKKILKVFLTTKLSLVREHCNVFKLTDTGKYVKVPHSLQTKKTRNISQAFSPSTEAAMEKFDIVRKQ